jgi:polysaccharide export outer membrane protein
MRGLIIALCAVFILAGCAGVRPPPLSASAEPAGYRLDTGDTLRLIVYNEDSLSAEFTVGDDGTVSIPTIGPIPARGLTVQQVQQQIYDGLNAGIILDPGLSVELIRYRPFFIVGEVVRPGQYAFMPGLNVLGAVAVAGGFTIRANMREVTIVRTQGGQAGEWSAEPVADLRPGDVVVIREQFF